MLAPCPFCGGEARAEFVPHQSINERSNEWVYQEYRVGCPKCNVFIKDGTWIRPSQKRTTAHSIFYNRLEVRYKWNYYASA